MSGRFLDSGVLSVPDSGGANPVQGQALLAPDILRGQSEMVLIGPNEGHDVLLGITLKLGRFAIVGQMSIHQAPLATEIGNIRAAAANDSGASKGVDVELSHEVARRGRRWAVLGARGNRLLWSGILARGRILARRHILSGARMDGIV